MLSDFRRAWRALVKARGFALIAILTLAVGIGSTTAIFSTLQALVLSPLHYPASDRLVHIHASASCRAWADRSDSISGAMRSCKAVGRPA